MSNKKTTSVAENSCDGSYGIMPVDNPAFVEKVQQIFGAVFRFLGYVDLSDKGCYVLVSPLDEASETIMVFDVACDEDISELSEYSFGLETDEVVCVDVLKLFCEKYLSKEDGREAERQQIYGML